MQATASDPIKNRERFYSEKAGGNAMWSSTRDSNKALKNDKETPTAATKTKTFVTLRRAISAL